MPCHCGSNEPYEACCAPLIAEERPAPTAEALMRSRYSAYVVGAGEYIVATTVPEHRVAADAELIRAQAESTQWLGLSVLRSSQKETEAVVEFRAFFRRENGIGVHHERSTFRRSDGRWYYESGILYEASVGRNEACPCGSGKKYKKCCGKKG